MFAIEWLKDGTLVERETSVLAHDIDVVASAKTRAAIVSKRLAGREPDSFRLMDHFGNEIRVFPIEQDIDVLGRIMTHPGTARTILI